MEKFILNLIKLLSYKTAEFDANVTCTFIFGQKKLPETVDKLKKKD